MEAIGPSSWHLAVAISATSCRQLHVYFLKCSTRWPATQIIGNNSLLFLQGSSHARIRGLVVKVINQPDALRKVTFENIGKYFSGFEPGPHLDTLDQLFTGMIKGVRSQPIKIPGTAYHHALQCRKKVVTIFTKEINKRKFEGNAARAEFDLLDQFLNLKDDDGNQLQDEEEEHMNVGTNGDFIRRDDILKLQYTNKDVEETIRLANVSAFVFRKAKRDVEYKGYKIPKGWKVICWLRYIHTDPKNFEDPLCFNPDRWNEQPKPGTFMVFGGGLKICPGNMLARMQVAIFIHHLVVRYRWELVNADAEMSYLPHPGPIDGVEINISRI
ncbi:ent-kaurenoic acid oxidase 1-like [Coffea arabica]|uniref:Ent-kaurenoic acid oxidase 1-like n=1 Tax=Coffea arabica TaxID=13443 RepID=A0ABM4UY70_COFAR